MIQVLNLKFEGFIDMKLALLMCCFQIKYPENFFLLRGNHECASINRIYGFYDECKRRYSVRLWKVFTDCFNNLPIAALIDEKVFSVKFLLVFRLLTESAVGLKIVRNKYAQCVIAAVVDFH